MTDKGKALIEEWQHNYEGAISDAHAAVDVLARVVLRTGDTKGAWWLCANWAKRVNCYPKREREKIVGLAETEASPPRGGTWAKVMGRPAVKATHPVMLFFKEKPE